MKRLILLLCLLPGFALAETSLFKPIDIFGLHYVSDPVVSSDGSFVVYTHNFMDSMEDRRRSGCRASRPCASGPDADRVGTTQSHHRALNDVIQ